MYYSSVSSSCPNSTHLLLHGPLRNPFPDPRNLGRRRRIRELRIPMHPRWSGNASLISGRHFRVSTTVSPSHVRNTQGSYLHSHPHDYPSGSQQQQVILSRTPHRDSNSDFRIFNATLPILIERISMRMLSRPTHCDSSRHRVIRNFVRVGYVQFVGLADGCDV